MTWSEDAEREQGENEENEASEPETEQPEAAGPEAADGAEQTEPPADDSAPEQPAAEEPAAEQPAAEEPAAAETPTPAAAPGAGGAKKDVVPGADLEPIAIGEERELTAEERAAREAEEEERRAREAAATAEDDEAIAPRSISVPADTRIQATGKRKSAVARVIVRAGDGSFEINDRDIAEYFKGSQHQALARQPLVTAGYEGAVDVKVRVHGGGISGQAGAVRHGVARALTALEPELRGDLKRRGMLTRDDRRKERKKAGLKKARKRPQFSKR